MHRLPSIFALLVLVLLPAVATAEEAPSGAASAPDVIFEAPPPPPASTAPVTCSGGRAVSEATLGRCCWPGQSFSTDRARCEGAPLCPVGSMAHGDECVIASVAPAPTISSSMVPVLGEMPRATSTEPISSMQHGVVGGGVTLLLAGYVAAVTYGPILSNCDGSGLVWLVPLAGGLIGSAMQRCGGSGYYSSSSGSDTADWAMAVGTAAFQIVGVVMLIAGATRRTVTFQRGPDGTRRVELDLGISPTLRF